MSEDRFAHAVSAFDAANARDPNQLDGRPKQLVEAERLSRWVAELAPDASEALRLAARCQHIERWTLPRGGFPEGRVGYLQWRTQLARFHADRAAEILRDVGYDEGTIEQVRRINRKQGLRNEPDTQAMEDALCLCFLEHDLDAFAASHDDEKVVEILRKTWKKMTERGHARASQLDLSAASRALLERALLDAPE